MGGWDLCAGEVMCVGKWVCVQSKVGEWGEVGVSVYMDG